MNAIRKLVPIALYCVCATACAVEYDESFQREQVIAEDFLYEVPDLSEASAPESRSATLDPLSTWLGWLLVPPLHNLVGVSTDAMVFTDTPPLAGVVIWTLTPPSGGFQSMETGASWSDVYLSYISGVGINLFSRGEYVLSASTLDGFPSGPAIFYAQTPPTASAITVSGTMKTGQTITFTGSGTIDELYSKYGRSNTPPKLQWTIAGKTYVGAVVRHVFSTSGSYTVKLKVYDGTFWSQTKTKTVTINSASCGNGVCDPGETGNCNDCCTTHGGFCKTFTHECIGGPCAFSFCFDNSDCESICVNGQEVCY